MLLTLSTLALIALADPPETKNNTPAPNAPTQEELAAISERGRNLADYDTACWYATDAVLAKDPRSGTVQRYIAQKTDKGWVVSFGKLDDQSKAFLVTYRATQGKDAQHFDVEPFGPPKQETGFLLMAGKAMEVALKDFVTQPDLELRRYNIAVLPAPKDECWVYLVPAPTKPGVWPLGGDMRYLISSDGEKIKERRRLHKTVIEIERPKGQDADPEKQVAGIHTHILAEIPEDTDVFHVLTRKPRVPELIQTEHSVFAVEVDGKIKVLGKPEDVLKKP